MDIATNGGRPGKGVSSTQETPDAEDTKDVHRGVQSRTPHEAFLSFAADLNNQALTV